MGNLQWVHACTTAWKTCGNRSKNGVRMVVGYLWY